MKKYFILFLLLPACTSLTVNLPASRMDPPEAPGKTWKKHLGGGIGASHRVTLISDASSRPPYFGNITANPTTDIPASHFSLGVGEKFELGLKWSIWTTTLLMGKFQFLGDSALNAKEGNFSMAATAGFGGASSNNSGDQNGVFGPGGYKWQASQNTGIVDLGLILGYRFSELGLVYGGPFLTKYGMAGNIHQDRSDNGTSPESNTSLSGSGQNSGVNLALQLHTSAKRIFSVTLEGVLSNFTWSDSAGSRDAQLGATVDFCW